ncbi:MAG: DMT family transporter [Rhodovarius sp.]|nr:DMT family transporter [Rhodovarius sp.]
MNPLTRMPRPLQGILYAIAAGVLLTLLNALLRLAAERLDVHQVQCLRYAFGLVVMLPAMLRAGIGAYRTAALGLQLWRGVLHTAGLALWFSALPFVPLSDVAAIGFTTPLFIMLGAVLFLREAADARRFAAVGWGFLGVAVVALPAFQGGGGWHMLLLLASAPLFAGSFLLAKVLTRRDSPAVIVAWQAATVALFSLPLALPGWVAPSAFEWLLLLGCGMIGSLGHLCLTRAYQLADISAAQPFKFLELVWASLWGFLFFAQVPGIWTFLGGAIIFAATTWIARAEATRPPPAEARRGQSRDA